MKDLILLVILLSSLSLFGGNVSSSSDGSSDDDEVELLYIRRPATRTGSPSASTVSRMSAEEREAKRLELTRANYNFQITIPDEPGERIRLPRNLKDIARCHPETIGRVVHNIERLPKGPLQTFWKKLAAIQLLAPMGTGQKTVMGLIQAYLEGSKKRHLRKKYGAKVANLVAVRAISIATIEKAGHQPTARLSLVNVEE